MKKVLSFLLAAIMVMSLVACGGNNTTDAGGKNDTGKTDTQKPDSGKTDTGKTDTNVEPQYAEEIVIGIGPKNLDPTDGWNASYEAYQQMVFDGLMYEDLETGEYVMQLAESVEWVDDTHMQLYVKLKDDVVFSNGDPVTAEDVAYSLQRATASYIAKNMSDCEVISDKELYINMLVPSTDFLTYLGWACGSIVCKAEAEKNPDGLALIGSGPYKYDMDSYVVDSSITLVKNDLFWGEATPTQRVRFVKLPDANAAAIALQSGEINYYQGFGEAVLPGLEADKNVDLIRYDSNNIVYMGFNDHSDTLSVSEEELNFRRAVACAINKEEIIAGLGGGAAMVSMLGADHPAYIANESDYEHDLSYNPEKAKEYLAKAGGKTEFNCLVATDRAWCKLAAQVIQEQCRQVGITMVIDETDSTGLQSMCKPDAYEHDSHIYSNLFVARNSGYNFERPATSGANRTAMNNPDVNEAIDALIAAPDQETKNEHWKFIQTEVHRTVTYLPLVFRQMNYGITSGLEGIKLVTKGPSWNMREVALRIN